MFQTEHVFLYDIDLQFKCESSGTSSHAGFIANKIITADVHQISKSTCDIFRLVFYFISGTIFAWLC